ncbi:hypothetical protein BsWGS_10920 [Bradybaena similaris]
MQNSALNMKVTSKSGTYSMDDEISEVKFDIVIDDDDEDEILIQAEDESFGEQMEERENEAEVDLTDFNFDEEMEDTDAANISVGVMSNTHGGKHSTGASGFDFSTGELWIYPTNYPVRDYQYNIVQQAMYKNTLVVLPTGLGKTFIAAVLMYNFFRWFPQGKIVFMAPTKPLVAQQIQACYNIMGIPKADTVEMTGTMSPALRQKAWREKRVVFLTPQVMTNDLSRGSVTAESIKCLVLDEAHKALGNHAYCQVVRELVKFTREFRILALSATPGSDLKAVQQMMNNLLISHIELRSEDSIDIRTYTHERKIDKIVVPLGEELSGLRLKYIQVMTCVVQRLIRNRVLYNRETTKLSKFLLLKARDEFRQNPPQILQKVQYGNIEADFAMAISLYHGFELLQLHGLRSLYNYLTGIIVGDKGYGRTRSELLRNADFNDIMDNLRQKFTGASSHGVSSESGDCKVVVGHPKMQRLEEIVVDHFKTYEKKGEATRVMIFSQYRDSVQEIATILSQHQPLIKVMPFIGQSSAGKSTKGYTQKEQLMVMQKFREGGYNTLVATCVGEEGLDIGDVDLIVCFDAHKSPIRLVQRMGRTGRKRQGRIVMLVTEGKEEQIYNQSLYSKKTIHKAILNGAKSLHFYPDNPRMLPSSVTPQCHKMHITLATESKKTTKTPSKNKRAPSNKNKTISDAFGKRVKQVLEDECLTAEEYADIKKEFSALPSTGKQLAKPRCIVLESDSQNDFVETNNSQVIDFSEWILWQNRLQSTHILGHSMQTVNLVKTSEFIELQRCIDDGEDHYGLEMSRILKDKDTESGIQRREGQSSMHYFFTNIPDKPNTSKKDTLCPGGGQRKKKHQSESRHRKNVEDNAITDAVLVGSDSSLDGDQEMMSATENMKPNGSKLFTELGHCSGTSSMRSPNGTSSMCSPNGIKNRSSARKKTESNKTRKLGTKSAVSKKVQPLKKKKLSITEQNMTTKIRKTSFLKLMETRSCNIPSTKDIDDFEVDCLRSKRSWLDADNEKVACSDNEADEDNVAVKNNAAVNIHIDVDVNMNESTECLYLAVNAIESCDNTIQKQEIPECQSNICKDKETCTDFKGKGGFCIIKPPPVSEMKKLFQSLKSGKEFRELDLEELMDQWSELGRDICTMTTSQQRVFMSAEKRQGLQFVQATGDTFGHETDLLCTHDLHEEAYAKNYKGNRVGSQTSVGELFISETKQSITNSNSETCKSADDFVKKSTPESPLFKCLINKTVLSNKHTPDRLPKVFEKLVTLEHQQSDLCKAAPKITCEDSYVQNCAQKAKTVQHVLSSKKVLNTDISIEENCDILMKSFIDEEEMVIKSCRNTPVSPVSFQESFVTFSEAMECLQTSSEEAADVLSSSPPCRNSSRSNVLTSSPLHRNSSVSKVLTSPPCRNSSRSNVYLEQLHFHEETSLCDSKGSKIDFAESSYHNLGTCDQYIENTAQNFTHIDKTVPCATLVSGNGSTKLSVNTPEVFIQDSLVLDSDSKVTGQKSKNQSSSDDFTETPVAGCSKLELPQFDLGFDFDDDDIIPPTPTKHLSQDSVFGLRTIDKHSLQETRSLLLSDVDKAPVSSRRLNSDLSAATPPTSAVSDGIVEFEPFTFDLQLSSDDSQDIPTELCTQDPPEVDTKKLQGKQLFSSNRAELVSKTFHQNKIVPPSEGGKRFHALPLPAEGESKKAVSLKSCLPSPLKKIKLPLNEHANFSEMENKIDVSDMISSEGWALSDKTSPRYSTKSKLRLGKRHAQEIINENRSDAVVVYSKDDEWQKRISLETSPQRFCKSLLDLDENSDNNKDICQNTNCDQMQMMPALLSYNPLNPASVCKTLEEAAVLPQVQYSPTACGTPARDALVKASTPVRDTVMKASTPTGGYHARNAVLGGAKDINMSELTPIKAKKDESECDSDDGFIVRRKTLMKAFNILSDQGAREDASSVNLECSSKARMLNVKQTEACKMKQVNKSLLESTSYSLDDDDDDMDDFKESHTDLMKPEQSTAKKKIKKKNSMGAVFIQKEAEVSGDDVSSDEQEDDDDCYEGSFIDNNTVMMQTQSTDMRAVYLKSIKSLVSAKPASYCRMQYNPKRMRDNVFSQTLPKDEGLSEYEEDSFCVGSDEEDIIYTEEESKLLEHRQKRLTKTKTGQRQKGKQRIQMISDTSSDEEKDSHIQMTQEFSIHPCKFGRKVLLSSSEDEGSRSKKNNASLCHFETKTTGSLGKSSKNVPMVKYHSETPTKSENLTKSTNAANDLLELNRTSQRISSQNPDVSNVGNFNLLGEADWLDDFDTLEPDSVNINASDTAFKEKHETEKCNTERKFLSLKDTSNVSDGVNKNKPLAESASCSSSSRNNSGVRFQEENSFKYCASSAFTNVTNKQFCDNSRGSAKCSDSGIGIKYQAGQSVKGNTFTSTALSHFSSPTTAVDAASGDNGASADVGVLETSLLHLNFVKQPALMTREERLRRQKEKQEMYRKKLQQVQQINSSLRSSVTSAPTANEIIPETICVNADIPIESHAAVFDVGDLSSHSQISPVFTKLLDVKRTEHQLQILVDSREISGAQDIISALRLKHGITVTARQLSGCDYILSNHLAADRVQWSSFSNSSCRSKLSSRLCDMQAMYERCVLIVEADRVKVGQEKSKRLIHRTKYLDTTLSYLMQSKIKVYFTDSVEETSALLADLCNVEDKKGRAISVPAVLSSAKEEMFRFVLSMPRVTVPQALNLAHKFRSVTELMSSPPGVIQERGCMTLDSAQSLHLFLRHKFDIQMMPSSKS